MIKLRLIPLLAPLLALFMLGCTEEIIKILKEVEIDTVYLPGPQRIDTVRVEVIKTETDTLLLIQTAYIYDTITNVVHHYHDTLVTFESGRVLGVYGEYLEVVVAFLREVTARGTELTGGNSSNLIMEQWTADEFPPASRSSYSYHVYDQFLIKIRESLTVDESYTPIFRELAREWLGKKYKTGDNIMNPDFPWRKITMSSTAEQKKPYLDKLFSDE